MMRKNRRIASCVSWNPFASELKNCRYVIENLPFQIYPIGLHSCPSRASNPSAARGPDAPGA